MLKSEIKKKQENIAMSRESEECRPGFRANRWDDDETSDEKKKLKKKQKTGKNTFVDISWLLKIFLFPYVS